MLSFTGLLERTSNYSQFFPLIDANKYRSNAPFSISDTTIRDTTDEIAAYFGEKRKSSTSSAVSTAYVGPKPSLSSMSSFHFLEERTVFEDIAEDEGYVCYDTSSLTRSGHNFKSSQLQDYSNETHILLDSPLVTSVKKKIRASSSDAFWFASHIEIFPITSRLSISVKQIEFPENCVDFGKFDFFAKISISPGNFKKQRIRIVPEATADSVTPKVYIDGISCMDLSKLNIRIKISMKRGFLKRSKEIKDIVVRLDRDKLQQSIWTALAKVSKDDL